MHATCPECFRRFDLTNPTDADEWAYGHDCEPPQELLSPSHYDVGIAIDGIPTYVLTVPSFLGRDAAERRARIAVAAMPAHRSSTPLDAITVCEV